MSSYYPQYNGNIPVFRGVAVQRGYGGLGGLFKGLARTIVPHLKRGLLNVGKNALKTGLQVLQDSAQGENIGKSLKRRSKEALSDEVNTAIKRFKSSTSVSPKKKSTKKGRRPRKQTKFGVL